MPDLRLKPSKFYEAQVKHWQFLLQSYESGQMYLAGGNLFRHRREQEDNFKDRVQRSVPPGFARAVINTYRSLLSRGEVSRETKNAQFKAFLEEDCDQRGRGLGKFIMETVFVPSQAVGWSWVLVDMPRFGTSGDAPVTLADKIEANAFPYCVHYDATQVINWSFDGFGNLEWLTLALPASIDPETGKATKPRVRLYDTMIWAEYTEHGKLLVDGEHGLGKVPFAILYNERSLIDQNVGLSAINNIAYINRECYNLMSLLQEFLYKQCFNVMALDENSLSEEGKKIIGTTNAIPVPAGGFTPQYVTPPSDPAQFLMDVIEQDIARIYHEAGLVDRSAQQVAQAQSGISRAFEFHNTNTMMVAKAAELERFEQEIADIWFRWEDQEYDYTVAYGDDYDIRDKTAELDEAKKVFDLPIQSPTLKQLVAKRLASVIAPDADAEEEARMIAEIEADLFQAAQAQGGPNPGGFSALAQRFNRAAA